MAAFTSSMKVFFYTNDPAALRAAGFDGIRVQKSTGRAATGEDVTDVDTDIILESTRFNYWLAIDAADTTDLFRAVLHAVDGTPADPPQAPQPATATTLAAGPTI